jgi:hypothetical protein
MALPESAHVQINITEALPHTQKYVQDTSKYMLSHHFVDDIHTCQNLVQIIIGKMMFVS